MRAVWGGPTLVVLLCVGGCLSARPTPFPVVPQALEPTEDGARWLQYDVDGDGRADYAEHVTAAGWLDELRFDDNGDGRWDESVRRADIAPTRQLVLILDSVPFEMVQSAQAHGCFTLFRPPSRIIAPFPAMTDMSLNELFGTSPSPGLESDRYDGRKMHDGWKGYPREDNSPWLAGVDWHEPYRRHGQAYLGPERCFRRELAEIERLLTSTDSPTLVAYSVGPSALGFIDGRAGHLLGLAEVERFCRMLSHRYRGRIAITLLSDHGHYFAKSRMFPLRRTLEGLGYRVSQRLREPGDVVVAGFGLISCAGLYSASAGQVARDIVRAEGVELAMYRAGEEVVVLSAEGRARVARCAGGWRYTVDFGDPLALGPIIARLRASGAVDAAGVIDDEALFAATVDHVYPDPLDRCWGAFHGLMEQPPDVLLSLAEGWHWGSPFIDAHITVQGAHGSLNRASTVGFIMSTQGTLPPNLRMRDVPENLAAIGVNLRRGQPSRPAGD